MNLKFIIQYLPKRSHFLATITPEEASFVSAHFGYLKKMLDEEKLVFAGRRTDAAFGIAIFEAASEQEAHSVVDNDPVVKAGVFTATVGQFQFALARDPKLL